MSQIDQVAAMQLSDSWFNAVIIESLAHGIYTTLVAVLLWQIVSINILHRRQTKVLVGISVFMYIMVTIHIAMRWYFALIDSLIAGGPLWVSTIASVVASVNILMADCVIIWRCWVIWGRNWRVIVLPSICTICGILFDVFFLIQELTPFTGSQGGSSTPWGSTSIKWGVAYYSMTLSTTIICTVLIVYRLVQARTTSLSLSVPANPYHRVMEVMVESAVLYVIALVVYIPFIATDNPYSLYPQVFLVSVTGIAPTLILLRVASGNQSGNTNPGSPDNTMRLGDLQSQSKLNANGSVTYMEEEDLRLIIPAKSKAVV
ncbi:uncharacterized protein EV420DRAFT_1583481 [Desarmillaria tabescens]|uniref:Uncharacterized protein n=1 Tax=Armillaria tabescens TaxID=1929756 RepID=A0AA39JCF7_ARMTA|nr:uncharacterized protein EV420DRAFT_1583481 [Desarmillaria tabescens]KAK0439482.1 hypothetical protein EV420DRAFT_1583481 [Desarmillaria tabescens]